MNGNEKGMSLTFQVLIGMAAGMVKETHDRKE